MNYLNEMRYAIERRQSWQEGGDRADNDPDKAAQYRANEIRSDDDARLMALASIAESLADIANALRDDDNNPSGAGILSLLETISRNTGAIEEVIN